MTAYEVEFLMFPMLPDFIPMSTFLMLPHLMTPATHVRMGGQKGAKIVFFGFLKEYLHHYYAYTVKPVYSDHPWDQEKVVVVQRWSLFRGSTCQIIIF